MQQSPQSSSFVTSRFAQLFLLLFLLVSLFSFGNGVGSEVRKKDRGLIIVPGLGRDDRLQTVVHNIKLLLDTKPEDHKHKVKWDCIIYIYAPRSDSFWQETSHLNYLTNFCKLIENPGKRCTEHLYMAQPALFQHSYEYVFILLDDCKFDPKISQPLDKLLDIMLCNNLTIVSPMISGANKGGGQKFRNIMQAAALPHTEGYVSCFVEIFVWLMTVPAYNALWELLYPEVNPFAWGYDFWYNGYAGEHVPGHKMGIASNIIVLHEQIMDDHDNSNRGRTDTAKVSTKWNAVLAQERHYAQHRQISLQNYRKHLDLANTSWNGAVKGYLQSCR